MHLGRGETLPAAISELGLRKAQDERHAPVIRRPATDRACRIRSTGLVPEAHQSRVAGLFRGADMARYPGRDPLPGILRHGARLGPPSGDGSGARQSLCGGKGRGCAMSEFGYTWQEAKEKHGRRKGDDEEEEVILDEDWSIEIQRLESEQPIDQRLIEKCLWVHSPVSVDEVETAKQHCVASIKLSSRTDKSRAERLKKAIALLEGTLAPYERCVVAMDTTLEHPATIEEQQAAETAIREIMPHNPQIKWHFHMEKSICAEKAMNVRIIASKND